MQGRICGIDITLMALAFTGLAACEIPDSFQLANRGHVGAGTIAGALVPAEESGLAMGNAPTVTVETRSPGGEWQEVAWLEVKDQGAALIDTVVIADNSGSEAENLEAMVEAMDGLAHRLLARAHPDRLGLVRVSTGARVVRELTTVEEDFDGGLDELFITNGWTALWDGARMANETLARGATDVGPGQACADPASRSIIFFTDGVDNNSADEKNSNYSDGIDTTLDDVLDLSVNGVRTTIYIVGSGDGVDEEALAAIAEQTGGEYRNIANYGGLAGALHGAAAQLEEQVPICFEPIDCAHTEAYIRIEDRHGNVHARVFEIPASCG